MYRPSFLAGLQQRAEEFADSINFKRTEHLYSFLLPTRNRTEQCIASIKSITENAVNKKCYEILFAFDDDDESRNVLIKYCEDQSIIYKAIVTERYGYRNLHKYVNKLCEIAQGDMLWLWNDDAKILTRGWDEKLNRYDTTKVLDFRNNDYPFIFPLVPSKYIKEMGYFSQQAHNDSWIKVIFKYNLKLSHLVPDVFLYHERNVEGTKIDYKEVITDTKISSIDFWSYKYKQLRLEDTNKIISKFFPDREFCTESA